MLFYETMKICLDIVKKRFLQLHTITYCKVTRNLFEKINHDSENN